MKECPYCKELSGDAAEKCFNCGKALPEQLSVKKICPKCRQFYKQSVLRCPECAVSTVIYDPKVFYDPADKKSDYGYLWYFAAAILVPIVGLIWGITLACSSKDEKRRYGAPVIFASVLAGIFNVCLLAIMR